MEKLLISPIKNITGIIDLPGSKSLSNRILLLAALSQGKTTITNLLFSDDVFYMLEALENLGVKLEYDKLKKSCTIEGLNGFFNNQKTVLYLGNAGTAMRPLAAALTLGSEGEFTLTGESRMSERPIKDLTDVLIDLGARINFLEKEGYPPLKIHACGLNYKNINDVYIKGNVSSQYLTALLISAPYSKNSFNININGELVSKPYIDITLDLIKKFGVEIKNVDYKKFKVVPSKYISPKKIKVEGDASSASYFLAAGAIKNTTIRVMGVGKNSIQGDIKFAKVLEAMGAKIKYSEDYIEVQGNKNGLKAIDMDMNHIPDAAMTIAITALFAKGTTIIRNIANWRVKECDRLTAMATELKKVGAIVEEGEDYISITPPKKIISAEIETYNDHRMAMCFSLVALSDVSVTILDPKCVSKTFPEYFKEFLGLTSE